MTRPRKRAGEGASGAPARADDVVAVAEPVAVAPEPPPPDASALRESARAERRGRALARAAFLADRAGDADEAALAAAMAARRADERAARAEAGVQAGVRAGSSRPRAFPTDDSDRWVPIGPSVVRRGQAEGRPRVTGRVRDLAVTDDGVRAYAASAKGGVWYTRDAGATWAPVGGWADRAGAQGGNNNAKTCGCLLVHFGATEAEDYVLVGTGETIPTGIASMGTRSNSKQGGVGVLAARGAGAAPVGDPVWEAEAGLGQLEGLGIYRLARRPGRTPGASGGAAGHAGNDMVVAATSAGLFLGERVTDGGTPRWSWSPRAALDAFVGFGVPPTVTDVLWLPGGGGNGRLVVAVMHVGVAVSDTIGAPGGWAWITNLDPVGDPTIVGRLSLALSPDGARLYTLGERRPVPAVVPPLVPALWRCADVTATPPTAAAIVPGLPPKALLWGTQRDYDQALAVVASTTAGVADRLFVGGSAVQPIDDVTEWSASLWCYDVQTAPALALVPAPRISRPGAPTGADPLDAGADRAGLVGNDVHADVHVVRVVRPGGVDADRAHVWVGCDGGVFTSTQGGRVNSFAPRTVGLATLEPGYVAQHPASSHFLAVGTQDNGTQVRVGDTVWEATFLSDGGGLVFHPGAPQYLIRQSLRGGWFAAPGAGFTHPLYRTVGGEGGREKETESDAAMFYSGAAAIRRASDGAGRIAIGTTRVWLSDEIGSVAAPRWGVLPAGAPALAVDARPNGVNDPALLNAGIPAGLGPVVQLRWVSDRELLVLHAQGVVRQVEDPGTRIWTPMVVVPGAAGGPTIATNRMTDLAPVPGTGDFYLTTVGNATAVAAAREDTCWYYEAATNTLHPTRLRQQLDRAGPPPVVGPLDPAFAVVVDPTAPTTCYVGTVTGVWRGVRTAPGVHAWTTFVEGLPQATVQDLAIWVDPAPGPAPAVPLRLLRAAVQARGVWEVRLDADEARRTYLRVHARDDRRRFPTPMANPRRGAAAPPEPVWASPDVVVRPRANPAAAPPWPFGAGVQMTSANVAPYQLWTFQTAFRWHYPSVVADGRWTDRFADLLELHRARLGLPGGARIDAALWNAVVGTTRLGATGAVTTDGSGTLAVYRAPWQTPAALDAAASEADLLELVVPRRTVGALWQVYAEPSTVDVLLHHRDTRPVAANGAFACLLWRSAPRPTALLSAGVADVPAFVASLLGASPAATPTGWTLAGPGGGASLVRLPTPIDARLPRAVSIDVDLSAVPMGHRVLFLAIAGSTDDPFTQPPVGAVANVAELVRRWPYAALRMVRCFPRPT